MKKLPIFIFLVLTSACPEKTPQLEEISSDEGFFKRECANLPRCDVHSSCDQGEGECFSGLCDTGSVCIDQSLACSKKCGTLECLILETYPGSIRCVND